MNKKEETNTLYFILGLLAVILFIYFFGDYSPVANEITNQDMLFMEPLYSVDTLNVVYYKDISGYLARPVEQGNYPGVIMIHEWWGLNDHIKEMGKNLAGQGYIVLAVDLYGGVVASEPDKARQLSGLVRENSQEAIENMKSAIAYLREEQGVMKVGSLGWCFGGQQSLQISLHEEIDATVVYYGNLITDTQELSVINHPVLGVFGSEDTSIPVETVNNFENALNSLGIEHEIYIYEGVGHAFANPSGGNFAQQQTKDAWEKTVNFLEKNLR